MKGRAEMTNQTINWNGQTLEISTEPNRLLSRLAGEEVTSLKVTSHTTVKPLIHDTFTTALIESAGGTVDFVDVMLSAQAA
jgi:hypothetical protein